MTDIESDRINCLPDQLIDKILSYLSIKEAGRTSVLSRKWGKKCNQRRLHGCSSNLLKIFDHQPHIVRLVIGDYFLKYLAAGVVPVKLPTPCMNLTYLGLLINFIDSKEISVVLCLLKSSPNIREFTMFVSFS
ncbi:unnamed protein product [Vicia faba]|uniref:F-box domain-containing protein n=1 Tax=Vicia faba TaxID=3906 RepID=A0AAV0ZW59_VICFA|nr:unnamed protein product [Vicia faba]